MMSLSNELYRLSTFASYPQRLKRYCASSLAKEGFYLNESYLMCHMCGETVGDKTTVKGSEVRDHKSKCKGRNSSENSEANKAPESSLRGVFGMLDLLEKENLSIDCAEESTSPSLSDAFQSFSIMHPEQKNLMSIFQSSLKRVETIDLYDANAHVPREKIPARSSKSRAELFYIEAVRLATYYDWPKSSPMKPADLAKAGFYYLGDSDRVCCRYCDIVLKNWTDTDVAIDEHRKHSPSCEFAHRDQKKDDLETDGGSLRVPAWKPSPHIGEELCLANPASPDFTDEKVRLDSYTNKKVPANQSPHVLANAGFYYKGPGDRVKCFYCGGTLVNWSPSDDPWVEHARYFPRCGYLRTRRDTRYIELIRKTYLEGLEQKNLSDQAKDLEDTLVSQWLASSQTNVENILSMGFKIDQIKEALSILLHVPGQLVSSEEVILAITEGNLTGQVTQTRARSSLRGEAPDCETDESTSTFSPTSEEMKRAVEENERLWYTRTCKVCLDEEVNVVFLPCGHLCCCNNCAPSLTSCPICRQVARHTVRAFMNTNTNK